MDAAEPAGDGEPPTVETLADLQAGLLDDETAARLRRHLRADAGARQTMEALNRVRREVAALGTDTSAPPLRTAHAVPRGRPLRVARTAIAVAGLAAVAVAAWVGTRALVATPAQIASRPTTIEHITVSRRPLTIPLSDQQILALLDREPDLGPLAEPRRKASCLGGLGYSADTRVLGARPIEIAGHPAVLLVLAGATPDAVAALAVAPTCSSVDTGLSADRIVHRP